MALSEEHKEKLQEGRKAAGKVRKTRSHTVRMGDGTQKEIPRYTRVVAMKIFCTECMGFQVAEVGRCTDTECPLFPFRKATRITQGRGFQDKA